MENLAVARESQYGWSGAGYAQIRNLQGIQIQDMQKEPAITENTHPTPGRISDEQRAYAMQMARAAVKAAAENRGQQILVIDLTGQTSMFDFFVIVTGSSRRQLHAIASEIDRVLQKQLGESRLSIAGYDESRWIVLDYGSVVVHLFDEETRSFYDLESLWADGQAIDVSDIVASASAQMTRISE
jgi:ribosome-associated protein